MNYVGPIWDSVSMPAKLRNTLEHQHKLCLEQKDLPRRAGIDPGNLGDEVHTSGLSKWDGDCRCVLKKLRDWVPDLCGCGANTWLNKQLWCAENFFKSFHSLSVSLEHLNHQLNLTGPPSKSNGKWAPTSRWPTCRHLPHCIRQAPMHPAWTIIPSMGEEFYQLVSI